MPIELECVAGSIPGKVIAVQGDRPRIFRILRKGVEAGLVEVEMLDGQCVVTNSSERPVLVNGVERRRWVLVHGDQVVIGKDTFRVREVDEGIIPIPPRHAPPDQLDILEPPSQSSPDPAPSPTPSPNSSDSDRRRRAISASASTTVESDRPSGILRRVQSVFGQRGERQRLDQLVKERQALLEEAGRLSFGEGFLGLPAQVIADLVAGRRVDLRPEEINRSGVDRWRELRERAQLLDTEINLLRREVGLGPDPEAVLQPAPAPRVSNRLLADRVFTALDAQRTEELPKDAPAALEDTSPLDRVEDAETRVVERRAAPPPAPAPQQTTPRKSGPLRARRHHR